MPRIERKLHVKDWRGVTLGMTRDQVIAILGEPDDRGGTSRKHPTPAIFKYGEVELHFEPWRDGGLVRVYVEGNDGHGRSLLG